MKNEPKRRNASSAQKVDIPAQADDNEQTCCAVCQMRNCSLNVEH
jgi:hypothetical protein